MCVYGWEEGGGAACRADVSTRLSVNYSTEMMHQSRRSVSRTHVETICHNGRQGGVCSPKVACHVGGATAAAAAKLSVGMSSESATVMLLSIAVLLHSMTVARTMSSTVTMATSVEIIVVLEKNIFAIRTSRRRWH